MVIITLRQKFYVARIRWSCISDAELDLKILNKVDQERQMPEILGDTISERLASVIKKRWSYEPSKSGNINKLHEKLLIPQKYGKICTPKLSK